MASNSPNIQQYSQYIPTNYIWDVQRLQQVNVNSDEFKELLVRMYQNLSTIALALNMREISQYQLIERYNGQQFFANPATGTAASATLPLRQVYRTVVNFGALPNSGTKSVAHNIVCTSTTTFTRIYACASDTTGLNYIPIPYASNTAGHSIELSVDNTNVTITTGSNRSNFNVCYVILEYLKL